MELSSQPNMKVTVTGGAIRWPGSFSLVGATTFESLQRLFFDKVFMGACGIHPEHGLTVIESDEALILAEMAKHAKEVIAVVDSSKLGMVSASRVCTTQEIDTIITDDSASPELIEAFRSKHVRVLAV
jgi:DeoR family transcriptional regulator, aga operon transcriptional repressor